jgi:hypothetical protein
LKNTKLKESTRAIGISIERSSSHPTISAAVQELIGAMQGFGFSRLRTRANFKGTKYLAEKETWVDYRDPS